MSKSRLQKAVEAGVIDEDTATSLVERAYGLSRVIIAEKE